ncbi:MAG: hypothetical protein ABIO96_11730 [Nitrospiraceae bacterium]
MATCRKAVKERSCIPGITVGLMARSAIDKVKGVETTLGEASNRTAEISKEGRRDPETWNSWTGG